MSTPKQGNRITDCLYINSRRIKLGIVPVLQDICAVIMHEHYVFSQW